MASDRNILIIGSDSLIGSALMLFLEKTGESVIGTTRRRESIDSSHIYFDLSDDPGNWLYPKPANVAIICAGLTKLDACKNDPLKSAAINVKAVSLLIKRLVKDGVFVIYLSSSQVFDGNSANRLPVDSVSPITEYGKQKAEVERNIGQWGNSIAIVRFSKVLGSRNNFFSGWTDALKNNRVIHPFSDIFISPIPLFFAVSVLDFMRTKRISGILQVSAEIDVSYADVAYRGAQLLGVNASIIQPIPFSEAAADMERLPSYSTLDTNRLKSVFGIKVTDVWWTIEKAFLQPAALDNLVQAKLVNSN